MADISKEYKTISQIAGPLVYVKNTEPVGYNEIVSIRLSDGTMRRGQVLDSSNDLVVVQVFEGTTGIDRDASVRFLGDTMKMPVSREMLGRVLSGAGDPLDGGAKIVPEKELDITGAAINPWARDSPSDFIQTGISTIDGMNTLVRGQKLPIFSQSGLPHNEMALQIARQAKVRGENEEFAVVFIAMGITNEEKQMFMKEFERTGALKNAVVFLNLADDPAVERTLTPRLGLTTAEYMAFDLGMQVLVIMTDITNYCEALRQIGAAREEVPGRRPSSTSVREGSRARRVPSPRSPSSPCPEETSPTRSPTCPDTSPRVRSFCPWTSTGPVSTRRSTSRPLSAG